MGMSGTMVPVRTSEPRPGHWTSSQNTQKSFPSGTSTAAAPVKPRARTLTPTSTPLPSTQTPSGWTTTNWSSARPTNTTRSQQRPTTERAAMKSWRKPRTKSPGSESNKNTPSWTKTCTPSDGPRTVSPDPRDPTTAVLVPTRSMAATLSRLTTELASTPVSTSQEQMPKSCQLSGSSRSDPVRVSAWETISGWDVSCSTVSQKTSEPSFPSTLSPCRVTGTEQELTPTSPPLKCVSPVARQKSSLPLTSFQDITFATSRLM